jgi:hypothetical protein
MPTTERQLLKCKACGWQWFPRPSTGKPRICPHCKSARWQIGRLYPERSKAKAEEKAKTRQDPTA